MGSMARDGYLKALRAIDPTLRKHMAPAQEKSAEEMASFMRRLVAVKEGNIQRSITAYAILRAAGLIWRVEAGSGPGFAARWLEFGTPHARAQPFFFVTYRALRRRALGRIRRAWKKGMQEVGAS